LKRHFIKSKEIAKHAKENETREISREIFAIFARFRVFRELFGIVRVALILSFCNIAVCFGSVQTQNTQQTANQLDEGTKLLSDGRFMEAVATFNRVKQAAPQDSRPYFYAGIALTEAGRLSAAALELNEAVRLDPRRLEYRVFQANVFARLKQKPDALSALAIFEKEGLTKQLDTAWLWLLNDVYQRLELFDQAVKIIDLLAGRVPNDSRVDLERGKIFAARREFDLALESFKKSIAKSPDNTIAVYELGRLLYQRGEMAESKKALLDAVKRDANNTLYLYRLGIVCLALNQFDEAIAYLQRAAADSTLHEALYVLANAYQRKGESAKAAEYRKRFREKDAAQRKREDSRYEVSKLIIQGELDLDQGRHAEAQSSFEQAIRIDPEDWTAHAYLAEMLIDAGDYPRAFKHLAKLDAIDPDSAVGNYLMARYWFHCKEFEKARVYAEKVKLVRPAHAELRNLLGKIYLGLGDRDKALQEFQAAVELAPGRNDYRENLRKND
jgi:tetratricopeptide (TPR) repeat protein